MKAIKTISLIIIAIFFCSCPSTQTKKLLKPNSVLTLKVKDSLPIVKDTYHGKVVITSAEPRYLEHGRGEGIGLGSSGTIGHGAIISDELRGEDVGAYAPEGIKIIEIKNTKVIKESSEFSEGRVVYKIPTTMRVRSTYQVVLRIAKSKATVSVYDSLKGEVMTSIIPVTQTMEVKLIDASPEDHKSFLIKEDNSTTQIIENGDTYTQWSWNVTPIKTGDSKLNIVVSIIRDGGKKEVVYTDEVKIESDYIAQIFFFLKSHWQVFMTAVVIPSFVGLWGIWKRRKKKKAVKKIT